MRVSESEEKTKRKGEKRRKMRTGDALGRESPSVHSCTWTTIGALEAESQTFAQSQAAVLTEHLVLNPDRLANAGAKGLTVEPLRAAKQATTTCTTPPAEFLHYM